MGLGVLITCFYLSTEGHEEVHHCASALFGAIVCAATLFLWKRWLTNCPAEHWHTGGDLHTYSDCYGGEHHTNPNPNACRAVASLVQLWKHAR
jgi:hypothetical protein